MLKSNNFPEEVAKFLHSEWGISHLFPPQKEALKPLMEGQNALICIPTASGKSLLAYLSIIKQTIVMKPGTQAVYIVPLKALAREKYEEFHKNKKEMPLVLFKDGRVVLHCNVDEKMLENCK